jgi:prepilin-type N-terminal cleavage/methylation domain-containing protein
MEKINIHKKIKKITLATIDYRLKTKGGFTLVELMVSLSLFTIVIMAAISSLYSVNSASRRVESMGTVLDNLNFAVDSLSRNIRTGTNVGCGVAGQDRLFGQTTCSSIIFDKTIGTDETVTYQLSSTSPYSIQRCTGNVCVAITSPNINVQKLSFFVEGSSSSDTLQPKVIIFLQGVATAGGNIAPFALQTQVSVRSAQ